MLRVRRFTTVLVLIVGCLFFTKEIVAQETEGDEKPKRRVPLLSAFASASYFAPGLGDLDGVYRKIEHVHALPNGGDFKTYYTLSGGVRFAPTSLQFLELEGTGSIFKSKPSLEGVENPPTNYLRMYSVNGSYVVNFPVLRYLFLSIGGGVGYVWLHSERSYSSRAIAHVNGELLELHSFLGGELFYLNGTSLMVRIGYSYATTMVPHHADCDFTLKGITIKAGFHVPILRI